MKLFMRKSLHAMTNDSKISPSYIVTSFLLTLFILMILYSIIKTNCHKSPVTHQLTKIQFKELQILHFIMSQKHN